MTGCLDALIQATLDRFPQSKSGRLENDASAHDFGVVRQVRTAHDIEIPLSVVLRSGSNSFFWHVVKILSIDCNGAPVRRHFGAGPLL